MSSSATSGSARAIAASASRPLPASATASISARRRRTLTTPSRYIGWSSATSTVSRGCWATRRLYHGGARPEPGRPPPIAGHGMWASPCDRAIPRTRTRLDTRPMGDAGPVASEPEPAAPTGVVSLNGEFLRVSPGLAAALGWDQDALIELGALAVTH